MKRKNERLPSPDDNGDYRIRDARRAFGQFAILESLMGEYLGEPYSLPYVNDTSFEPFFARMVDIRTQRYACYKVFLQYIDNWRQAYAGAFWFGLGETTETNADADKFIASRFTGLKADDVDENPPFKIDCDAKAVCAGDAIVHIAHLDDRPDLKLRPKRFDTFLYDNPSPSDHRVKMCEPGWWAHMPENFVQASEREFNAVSGAGYRYILTTCKTPEEVVDSLDFRFLQCGYVGSEKRVIIRDRRALCLLESEVVHPPRLNTESRIAKYRYMGATILSPSNPGLERVPKNHHFVAQCPRLNCNIAYSALCGKGHPLRCCPEGGSGNTTFPCYARYGGGCPCTDGLCAVHFAFQRNRRGVIYDKCRRIPSRACVTSAIGSEMRRAWENMLRCTVLEVIGSEASFEFEESYSNEIQRNVVVACFLEFAPARSEPVTRIAFEVGTSAAADASSVVEHRSDPEQTTYCFIVLDPNQRFVSLRCTSACKISVCKLYNVYYD